MALFFIGHNYRLLNLIFIIYIIFNQLLLMKWMWANYLPDLETRKEYYATPFNASLEQLKGLPPALVQLAENDILFDEGLAYARKLDEAGVPTTIQTYNGFIHDYGLLNPLDHIEAIKFSSEQGALALKKALFGKA